jgi:hypothetical protein
MNVSVLEGACKQVEQSTNPTGVAHTVWYTWPPLVDTALSLISLFCATGAFDGDAFHAGHLACMASPLGVPGDLRAVSWSSFALRYAFAFTGVDGIDAMA